MKPKTAQAEELIRKLISYLKKHRERFNYRSLRLGGYPIGSGGIESANKIICHTRMKRSGAWWVKVTGNSMHRILCAIYNGTYDDVFPPAHPGQGQHRNRKILVMLPFCITL
jgi:hypothetical protein